MQWVRGGVKKGWPGWVSCGVKKKGWVRSGVKRSVEGGGEVTRRIFLPGFYSNPVEASPENN